MQNFSWGGILGGIPGGIPMWDFGTGSRLESQVGSQKKIENPRMLKFLNQAPGILESQVGSHKKIWKSHNFEVSQSSTRDPGRDNLVSRMLKSAILGGINWHPWWDKLVSQVGNLVSQVE